MESTSGKQERRCTGVYGWLETTNKHHTCDLIHHLASSYSSEKELKMAHIITMLGSTFNQTDNFYNVH